MADTPTIRELKTVLRAELRSFCSNNGRVWKQPVVDLLHGLRRQQQAAVFFGGTLRSLLISRLNDQKPGRPRDIDLVVKGCTTEQLSDSFEQIVTRETRFGGLQLQHQHWQFDVWPLEKTWAFVEDQKEAGGFDELPETTFLNLEAIAVEVWPRSGKGRVVFSGDDQFFEGIANRVVELNREANPFPSLCVVRSLVLAARLNFSIGPRLANYIVKYAKQYSAMDYETVQRKHYGCLRVRGDQIESWTRSVKESCESGVSQISLPVLRQKEFWKKSTPRNRLNIISMSDPAPTASAEQPTR